MESIAQKLIASLKSDLSEEYHAVLDQIYERAKSDGRAEVLGQVTESTADTRKTRSLINGLLQALAGTIEGSERQVVLDAAQDFLEEA